MYFGIELWQWSLLASLPLIYWYFTHNLDYWTKRGIKGPKPLPIFGNILSAVKRPLNEVRTDWYRTYGKIYGFFNGSKPVLSIGEPELIKQILVKDFHIFRNRQQLKISHPISSKNLVALRDNEWKRVRSITSPTFSSGKLKRTYPLMKACAKEFIDSLTDYAKEGKDVNLKEIYGNYTMDVIAKCAFATTTNSHKDPNNAFIAHAKEAFKVKIYKMAMIIAFPKFLLNLFGIRTLGSRSANEFYIKLVSHIIKKRRENNEKNNDLLQLLIDAVKDEQRHDENDIHEAHHVNEGEEELEVEERVLNSASGDKYLTNDEIIAQAVVFFLAGYETTASTLSFASYELAFNSDVQEKLREEIKSNVDSNGDIDYETLFKLPYLDAVICEALRKHSPAISLSREASVEYHIPNTDITLYKGQSVEIPVYCLHHSSEYYSDPEKFDPSRFLPENRSKLIPYTYLPFGGGPRNCIGMRFALMEANLGLAQIILRYKLFQTDKTEVPLKFRKSGFGLLQTESGIHIGIEKV